MTQTHNNVAVADVEAWVGQPLPPMYRALLPTFRDAIIGEQVLLYPLEYVIERNETWETKKYCPGYIAIGDDSGGRVLLISLSSPDCFLFWGDTGFLDPNYFKPLDVVLRDWLAAKCPVH